MSFNLFTLFSKKSDPEKNRLTNTEDLEIPYISALIKAVQDSHTINHLGNMTDDSHTGVSAATLQNPDPQYAARMALANPFLGN